MATLDFRCPMRLISGCHGKSQNSTVRSSGQPSSIQGSQASETKRRLETRLKEHREGCQRQILEKSAVAEHAWKDHHSIRWEEAKCPGELPLKVALHIYMTPVEERLNRDTNCWMEGSSKPGLNCAVP